MNTAAESSSFECSFSGTNENKALQHSLSNPSGKEKLLTELLKREFALLNASFQRCVSGKIICVWYFQYFLFSWPWTCTLLNSPETKTKRTDTSHHSPVISSITLMSVYSVLCDSSHSFICITSVFQCEAECSTGFNVVS